MLYEIACDEFKQRHIKFFPGLNTVLGDEVGNNSIGKSTFLMIIDYVFGGQDYIVKSTDIQRNVGNHTVKFCFIFDNHKYYFSRNTNDQEFVNCCDENYSTISKQALTEYLKFLKVSYKIGLPYLSFRGAVGRYIRVYGRDNIDEKRPLNSVPNEKSGSPVTELLKLFNLYQAISELESLLTEKKESLTTFRKAQRFSFIPKTGVRQYRANIKELDVLHMEVNQLSEKLNKNLLDMDSITTEEVLNLKKELSILRRQRSLLLSKIYSLRQNMDNSYYLKEDYFSPLLEFFPNVNLKRLEEIEQFHAEINSVLQDEFKLEEKNLKQLIDHADRDINILEQRISKLTSSTLSQVVLSKHSELIKKIENLTKENKRHEQENDMVAACTIAEERTIKMRTEQLSYLQNILNFKMASINDYIYFQKKKAPTISFHNLQYDFETRDDTGTGTSYKGLVVYDLSVLSLTELPILVHDSVVLKQIADEAIERILQLYQDAGKQIFIALDKAKSYTPVAERILSKTAILKLTANGNELFGRSWNEKVN